MNATSAPAADTAAIMAVLEFIMPPDGDLGDDLACAEISMLDLPAEVTVIAGSIFLRIEAMLIDRSFVIHATDSHENLEVVRTIARLAETLQQPGEPALVMSPPFRVPAERAL